MKTLALIGCGEITKMHTSNFNQMKDIVTPVAFCDLIIERAEDRAARCGGTAKVYTDYKVMLDEVKPDMVFIAVPPYCHGEIEMDLIDRGIPFFVQKPMTLDLELARKIRNRIKETGLITAVGLQSRYSDICEPAREYARTHKIVGVDYAQVGGVPPVEWWCDKKLSGGKIVETSIHYYDLIRYIMGDVDEVYAMSTTGFVDADEYPNYHTDDVVNTVFKFKSGAIGSFTNGNYTKSKEAHPRRQNIRFSTRHGRGEFNAFTLDTFEVYGESEPITYTSDVDYGLECDRTFVEAVISGDRSKIRTSYEDVFGSLALVLALRKSADTGMPTKVENE